MIVDRVTVGYIIAQILTQLTMCLRAIVSWSVAPFTNMV